MGRTFASDLGGDDKLALSFDAATRRALGVYFTPEPVARLMAGLLQSKLGTGSHVIDPSAGSGRLLLAALEKIGKNDLAAAASVVHGVEREPRLAAWADGALSRAVGVERSFCRVADGLSLLETAARRELFGRTHFGAVIANPPYVREKNNRVLFEELRRRVPAWSQWFRPRQDLQQLFLVLGVLLLELGGELVYLVNPYWLHSDSGQPLRALMSAETRVLSVVDFGERRLFRDAPGQHHLLIHARRDDSPSPSRPTRFVRVTKGSARDLEALCLDLEQALRGESRPGGIEVSESSAPIGRGERLRWYWPSPADDRLALIEAGGVPLGSVFRTHQGVVSGADCVTRRNRTDLDPDLPLGTGIFIVTDAEAAALGLNDREQRVLKPLYRARDIDRFVVGAAKSSIIYLTWRDRLDGYPAIRAHLERFRPLLSRRREVRLGKMPWFALHWPRDPALFDRPRIVTPRRAKTPRFAMAIAGHCEQSDIAMITDPGDDVRRLQALLTVLNSEPIATWSRYRGKHKGQVREFFGRALEEIPIPRAALYDPPAFAKLADYARCDRAAEGRRAVEALYRHEEPSAECLGSNDAE